MPSYKENVIEESRKRAGEVLGQIQHLRRQIECLEREYGEIATVLRALGAENQLGVAATVVAKSIMSSADFELVKPPGKGALKLSRKVAADIIALKEFRRHDLAGVLRRDPIYAEVSDGTIMNYGDVYIWWLLKKELIVRMKRGHYAAVTKELPQQPEPKVRDDIPEAEDDVYTVEGALTCEKPGERGYGQR